MLYVYIFPYQHIDISANLQIVSSHVLIFTEVTECPPVNEMCSLPNLITANRSFLIDQINVITLLNAFNRETAEKFEKAGINEAIEITKKAEVFLDVVEKEGLYEAFYNNLQTKGMTYVLNRLQTCKKVCAAGIKLFISKFFFSFFIFSK